MKLSFRERLRGYVGNGADEAAGFAEGRRSGGAVSFAARATIDDLDAFEADPRHRVRLEGEAEYEPLGRGRLLEGAELQLLVPRPGGRALRYRLPFEVGGRRLELRGEKRIGAWPGYRSFTTLYVELLEEGEPIARGRLHVPLGEALRFAFGMRGAGGPLSGLAPGLRLLRFVLRETAPLALGSPDGG